VINDAERNVNDQMIDVVKYLIKYQNLIWLVSYKIICMIDHSLSLVITTVFISHNVSNNWR
jgi:hypothetical protein